VKIATEGHDVVDPDTVDRKVSPREIKAMVEIFRPFLPGLSERCVKAKVCLYTEVNGARFILDRLPGNPNIIVASPCSGHGFKFAPVIGDVVADLVIEGRTRRDISRFSLGRFG